MRRPSIRRPVTMLLTTTALAGLLAATAAPVSANHLHCGSVITTDTKLDSDIGPCVGDGLIIGADDIRARPP